MLVNFCTTNKFSDYMFVAHRGTKCRKIIYRIAASRVRQVLAGCVEKSRFRLLVQAGFETSNIKLRKNLEI